MAIASVIALLVVLGLAALSLQPWAANSVAPRLGVAPGLGIGLGDSVVVSRNRQLAVAPVQPTTATGAAPRFAAAGTSVNKGVSQQLGISAARVVTSAAPAQSPGASPEQPVPEPPAPTSPTLVPAPVPVSASPPEPPPPSAPVVAAPGGEMHGPVAAGGGVVGGGTANVVQVCEGDDYTLSLAPGGTEGSEVLPSIVRHDLTVYFGSLSEGAGFYLVLFDGQPVEIGDDPVPVEPGKNCAQIDLGPLLGESIEAGTEIHVEAATVGEAVGSVVP